MLRLDPYDAEFSPATGLIYALGGRSDASTLGSIYRTTRNRCLRRYWRGHAHSHLQLHGQPGQ
jgi:hypothetical protein